MANLTHASRELFSRRPDERFASVADLARHCRAQKAESVDRWQPLQHLAAAAADGALMLTAGSDGAFAFNEWSFSQLCGLARVSKDTLNRLTPDTASRVFAETLRPTSNKPLQLLTSLASASSTEWMT